MLFRGSPIVRCDPLDRCHVRAHTMKSHRKTSSKPRASQTRPTGKDVLQFAPNFTVYVLPPDVVCLYSEDRKFFLHGELYCALAAAIGKNGKSAEALVRELARKFPSDKIEEALKRMIERRYVDAGFARFRRPRGRILGEPRAAARGREAKSRELPPARRSDRRERREGAYRGFERAWRAASSIVHPI